MPIEANTYGSVEDVERQIGDIVDDRTFTIDSDITIGQVEATLNRVADMLNAHLLVMEYVVPVNEDNDPEAHGWIKEANSAGASVRILNTMPGQAMDFDQEEASTSRKESLWAQVKDILSMIDEGRFPTSRNTSRLRFVKPGATGTSLFRRGMMDIPGTRNIR